VRPGPAACPALPCPAAHRCRGRLRIATPAALLVLARAAAAQRQPRPARRESWSAAAAAPLLAQQLQRLATSLANPATGAAQEAWGAAKLQAELTALVEALALVSRQAHTSAPVLRRLCLATLWQLQAAGVQAGSWGEQHEALLQEALLLWLLLHRQVCAGGRALLRLALRPRPPSVRIIPLASGARCP
jgi:hypothetical protein